MSESHEYPPDAAQHYAVAHAIHYKERDWLEALQAYGQVIERHPLAVEAEYARSQLRNIVKLVVPAAELLASQLALGLRHLQGNGDDSDEVSQ